ncbi:hypothetical protein [Myxococcus sp. CA040A]|uniref:hypothetical protein n=1 Tax=Myxococcus sp. CA040A TaxID=2741738 RepID=UPI00157B4B6D|nr:hypothetical protein [Myxococcus sp. CA040A]NTX09088.1 hypothetical protein [Myxococcus sp. CA040A]
MRIDVALLVTPAIPGGRMVRVGDELFVRHMSELFLVVAGARWHPAETGCPAWTSATECQCTRGGDA